MRLLLACACLSVPSVAGAAEPKPNVVYIMADELGLFEPGFMGGKEIATPNLDRMAKAGIVFKNVFSGAPVCAPARCTLLTGKHAGHASVRANDGGTPLRADEQTIADVLKKQGYACGGFGKWGCGGRDSTGVPEKHGCETFFGYYDQVHAHTFYPPYLIRNSEEVKLDGNRGGLKGKTYSQYVIHDAAKKWIREHAKGPFFAFLPYTPPHGPFAIPDTDPACAVYKDKPWPEDAKLYAAMTTMLDRHVGEILDLLNELGVEKNTLVLFSGDNGGKDAFATKDRPRGLFSANKDPNGTTEYRGSKGDLYEGGLRVPFAAYWPAKIEGGRVSAHLGYFPDVLPTIAEATGAEVPKGTTGLSFLPELLGKKQPAHDHLYWEFGKWVAVRQGNWRAVKSGPSGEWELYDVGTDTAESKNVAKDKPDVLKKLQALADAAHQPVKKGTYTSTERHERDRRAKAGKEDNK
jgi:arylsulfatase A-like enzyme